MFLNTTKPAVEPCTDSTARSGWAIMPSTTPELSRIPAIPPLEPVRLWGYSRGRAGLVHIVKGRSDILAAKATGTTGHGHSKLLGKSRSGVTRIVLSSGPSGSRYTRTVFQRATVGIPTCPSGSNPVSQRTWPLPILGSGIVFPENPQVIGNSGSDGAGLPGAR